MFTLTHLKITFTLNTEQNTTKKRKSKLLKKLNNQQLYKTSNIRKGFYVIIKVTNKLKK